MLSYNSLAKFKCKFFRYGLVQLHFLKFQIILPSGSLKTSNSLPLIRNDKFRYEVQLVISNLLLAGTCKNNLLRLY